MAEVHFDKNIKVGIPQSAINWCKTQCMDCEKLLETKEELNANLCDRCSNEN